jgi:hypothetical protein
LRSSAGAALIARRSSNHGEACLSQPNKKENHVDPVHPYPSHTCDLHSPLIQEGVAVPVQTSHVVLPFPHASSSSRDCNSKKCEMSVADPHHQGVTASMAQHRHSRSRQGVLAGDCIDKGGGLLWLSPLSVVGMCCLTITRTAQEHQQQVGGVRKLRVYIVASLQSTSTTSLL